MKNLIHSRNFETKSFHKEAKSSQPSLTSPDMSYSIKTLLEKFTTGITPPVMRDGHYDSDASFENYDKTRNGDFDLTDATQELLQLEKLQAQRKSEIAEKQKLKAASQKLTMDEFHKWKKDKTEKAIAEKEEQKNDLK